MNLLARMRWSRGDSVPLLKSARSAGRRKAWCSEEFERLLTPTEIEQVQRGRM